MTPAEAVHWAQGLSALCWLIEAVVLGAVARGAADRRLGALAGMLALVGVTHVLAGARWWWWPDAVQVMGATECSAWLALYAANCIEALFLAAGAAAYRWRR